MKSNISVFSFSHWGFTQLTNKRAKKVAWIYSTNLQTYILYILFASFFTIKYDLLPPYPSKYYLLPILKICKPPDLFLGLKHLAESKVWLLRCSIRDACAAFHLLGFLAVQPVPCICTLAIYMFLSPLYYCIRWSLCLRRQPADPVIFIWCLAHCLIFHAWPLSLCYLAICISDCSHHWSSAALSSFTIWFARLLSSTLTVQIEYIFSRSLS